MIPPSHTAPAAGGAGEASPTLEEDIRHLRALLARDCKRAIKDIFRRHAQDIS